jgi:hypothetical protein
MKKHSFIWKIPFVILVFACLNCCAQKHFLKLGFRIQGQEDFQNETFAIGEPNGGVATHKSTAFNYGADMLAIKKTKSKINIYGGVGFFRNKFNFTKRYDHRLLNPGIDSSLLGTSTKNYVYSLLRFPLGIDLLLKTHKNKNFSLSVENIFNFSFLQTYNGGKPFPNANSKLRKFKFYGYNLLFRANLTQNLKNGHDISISPYLRVFNLYNHTDPVLYQDETGNYIRWIDAVGLSVLCSFQLKK